MDYDDFALVPFGNGEIYNAFAEYAEEHTGAGYGLSDVSDEESSVLLMVLFGGNAFCGLDLLDEYLEKQAEVLSLQ